MDQPWRHPGGPACHDMDQLRRLGEALQKDSHPTLADIDSLAAVSW